MSLHRRPIGRGRVLAGFGALVLLVASVLPWFTAGAVEAGIPPISGNAFDGASIAVFVVAVATLALMTLPYAAGDRPVGVDRWWAYAGLASVGWLGLALRAGGILAQAGGIGTIVPDRAPGLWLAVVGLAILTRAAYDIAREPVYR